MKGRGGSPQFLIEVQDQGKLNHRFHGLTQMKEAGSAFGLGSASAWVALTLGERQQVALGGEAELLR